MIVRRWSCGASNDPNRESDGAIAMKLGTLEPMAASDEKKEQTQAPALERMNRGLLGLGLLTERVARPVLGKRGFSTGQVIAHWSEIVGPELAANTAPERVQFDRGARTSGTLHLRVSSGAAAVLIQPQSATIIERVNAYLGAGTVKRIKVVQGPIPRFRSAVRFERPAPLDSDALNLSEQEVKSIKSDTVRAALSRLGARLRSTKS